MTTAHQTDSFVPRPLPDFISQPIFLHGSEIKSGSSLGTRLLDRHKLELQLHYNFLLWLTVCHVHVKCHHHWLLIARVDDRNCIDRKLLTKNRYSVFIAVFGSSWWSHVCISILRSALRGKDHSKSRNEEMRNGKWGNGEMGSKLLTFCFCSHQRKCPMYALTERSYSCMTPKGMQRIASQSAS